MTWIAFFGLLTALQVGYLLAMRVGSRRACRALPTGDDWPAVSVVVSARDEAERIGPLLDALAEQTHPDFEVIVVDDGSRDGTVDLVRRFAEEHAFVRLVAGPGTGKKTALTVGIAAARHGLLVFTDADGRPGPEWLRAHAAAHAGADGPLVLVGYGPLRAARGWFGALMRYDADLTAFQAAAAIGLGRAFMAVGRNLSYARSVFDGVGGHAATAHLLSGDDDLFVQAVRRTKAAEIRYLSDPRGQVPSSAPPDLRAWLRQKTRHTSAGRRFLPSVKVHLALFHGSAIGLWLAPAVLGWMGLVLLGMRLGVLAWAVVPCWRRFGSMDLLPRLIVLDLLYAVYDVFVPPFGLMVGPRRW